MKIDTAYSFCNHSETIDGCKLLVIYIRVEFYSPGIGVEESSGKPAQLTTRPQDLFSYAGPDGAFSILIHPGATWIASV